MSDVFEGWDEFPKIGLLVDGAEKFYPLAEAIPLWDSGWDPIEETNRVMEVDFSVRPMTMEEQLEFQRRADDYSAGR